MATFSSVLAWRIPGTGGLVGCCLWGRTESDMTEVTWQQQQHTNAITGITNTSVSVQYVTVFILSNVCMCALILATIL